LLVHMCTRVCTRSEDGEEREKSGARKERGERSKEREERGARGARSERIEERGARRERRRWWSEEERGEGADRGDPNGCNSPFET
jgi:hypothetical protein